MTTADITMITPTTPAPSRYFSSSDREVEAYFSPSPSSPVVRSAFSRSPASSLVIEAPATPIFHPVPRTRRVAARQLFPAVATQPFSLNQRFHPVAQSPNLSIERLNPFAQHLLTHLQEKRSPLYRRLQKTCDPIKYADAVSKARSKDEINSLTFNIFQSALTTAEFESEISRARTSYGAAQKA